jgi:hypothetical protein
MVAVERVIPATHELTIFLQRAPAVRLKVVWPEWVAVIKELANCLSEDILSQAKPEHF